MTPHRSVPSVATAMPDDKRLDRALKRGAGVNVLGLVAKLVHPLYFAIVGQLFGAAVLGVFFQARNIAEIANGLITSGYSDGVIIFASRDVDHQDEQRQKRLYEVLGSAFAVSLGLSVVVAAVGMLFGKPFAAQMFPNQADLGPAIQWVSLALPAIAFTRVGVAATKAHMRMEYDAVILGFLQPASLVVAALSCYALGAGLVGLMLGYTASWSLCAVATAYALGRHFSLGRIFGATVRSPWHGGLLEFAVPQSLNITFAQYSKGLDTNALAYFGASSAEVGYYGAAAEIATTLRTIRIVFSQAVGPVIARLHADGSVAELETTIGRISRWATSICIAVLPIAIAFREDLVRVVLKSPPTHVDSSFFLLLLVPPLISCAYGMAGNAVAFTGHSRVNLTNALLSAALSTGMMAVLVPRFHMMGAALAFVCAAVLMAVLQTAELKWLERVTIPWREMRSAYAALLALLSVLLVFGDPAPRSVGERIAFAGAAISAAALAMFVTGHAELRSFVRRLFGRWSK